MKTITVLACLLFAGVLGFWLFSPSSGERRSETVAPGGPRAVLPGGRASEVPLREPATGDDTARPARASEQGLSTSDDRQRTSLDDTPRSGSNARVRPGQLRGAVQSEQGPIQGVQVDGIVAEQRVGSAQTDAQGRFDLRLARASSTVSLQFRARGYAPYELVLTNLRDGDSRHLGNIRLSPGTTLAGQVLDRRASPVPDCEIRVQSRARGLDANRHIATARTDAQGRFRYADAPPGPLLITAIAKGQGSASIRHDQRDGKELQLVLGPERKVLLHLVDEAGTDVPDVLVRLNPTGRLGEEVDRRTDETGRVEFDGLSDAPWNASVISESHRPRIETNVQADGEEVEIILSTWPCVTGTIRTDEEDIPAETTVQVLPSGVRGNLARLGGGTEHPVNGDGTFRVCGIRPGPYIVRLQAPGYAPSYSKTFQVGTTGDQSAGSILLLRGGALEVLVRGEDAPIEGAMIGVFATAPPDVLRWTDALGPMSRPLAQERSNPDGKALIDHLESGSVWTIVQAPGHVAEIGGPFTVTTNSTSEVTVRLLAGGRVVGKVIDNSGKGLASAVVSFTGHELVENAVQAVSGPDGSFASPPLPPGRWNIQGRWMSGRNRRTSFDPETVVLTAGEDTNFELVLD